jgi:hypothetical protein
VAGIVASDKVAVFATNLPAVFMQCAPGLWVEAEALGSGALGERSLYMGEWGFHMSSRFWKGSVGRATDTTTIYRKLSRCNGLDAARVMTRGLSP